MLIGILILLWLLGFSFEIAGGIIHVLIVIALILVIFNLVTGRRM
ncbi:lmo0937 family membrane protein [Alkalihalobacterium elongatum]|nr:lmo0937 family membrane protein [Alkalihalobacterium elongatum]